MQVQFKPLVFTVHLSIQIECYLTLLGFSFQLLSFIVLARSTLRSIHLIQLWNSIKFRESELIIFHSKHAIFSSCELNRKWHRPACSFMSAGLPETNNQSSIYYFPFNCQLVQ